MDQGRRFDSCHPCTCDRPVRYSCNQTLIPTAEGVCAQLQPTGRVAPLAERPAKGVHRQSNSSLYSIGVRLKTPDITVRGFRLFRTPEKFYTNKPLLYRERLFSNRKNPKFIDRYKNLKYLWRAFRFLVNNYIW